VVADIWAREIPLGPGTGRTGFRGIQIAMDGDRSPSCSVSEDWRCDGGGYTNYTVEVVDRMGYDSFTPDHGVLLAKTKNADLAPFIWVVDAHPEDIELVDYVKPDGEDFMISKGDYRQLSDALFHAGTGEGVVGEFVDTHNRLHFYVLDIARDDEGVLSYRVAVRSLDGDGPFARGVSVGQAAAEQAAPGRTAVFTFPVTNTGDGTDIIRLTTSTEAGWPTRAPHAFVEVEAGETIQVPVYVTVPEAGEGQTVAPTTLTFALASETDPEQTATTTASVEPVQ